MQTSLTRRGLVIAAGAVALGGTDAFAATEDELAWLRLGASAELVAEALCAGGARARALSRGQRRRFHEARLADRRHYELLASAIGADAPTEADFSIGFRRGTLASRDRLLGVALRVKRTLVGLNLGAAAAISDPRLRALTARIAASEAAHVSYLSSLAGHGVLGAALPKPLSMEQATEQLSPFWGDARGR